MFLLMGNIYAEEIGAEDKEIIEQLEFFSNLDLLEENVDFEDLEKMEVVAIEQVKKKEEK